MLVLSRKAGQEIVIGDDIRIRVILLDEDRVKIGIEAPKDISVHRLEIYEKITK